MAPPLRLDEIRILEHPLGTWGAACMTATGIFALLLVARGWVTSWLAARAQKTASIWDDLVVDVARRTSVFFLAAIAVGSGCRWLELPEAWRGALSLSLAVVSLVQTGLWGNGIIGLVVQETIDRRAAGDMGSHKAARNIVMFLARGFLFAVVGLLVANQFGFSPNAVFTGLGVFGLALTLATQNIVGDIFASMSILLDKPFLLGDFIIVDDCIGTVERIGIKTTRLRSLSGENIVLSNTDLTRSRIRNFRSLPTRRIAYKFTVAHDTPIAELARIGPALGKIIEAEPKARFDRAELLALCDNGLAYEVVFYVLEPSYNTYAAIQQRVHLALLAHLRAAGVRLGVPAREHRGERPGSPCAAPAPPAGA